MQATRVGCGEIAHGQVVNALRQVQGKKVNRVKRSDHRLRRSEGRK